MNCKTFELGSLGRYRYVVTISSFQGKLLFSRHKARSTWECQGGHIEPGESPLAAAKRELWEESGAIRYDLSPLCDYCTDSEEEDNGMVFTAVIHELGVLPESEIAEVRQFDCLPTELTYPDITPVLIRLLNERTHSESVSE